MRVRNGWPLVLKYIPFVKLCNVEISNNNRRDEKNDGKTEISKNSTFFIATEK